MEDEDEEDLRKFVAEEILKGNNIDDLQEAGLGKYVDEYFK